MIEVCSECFSARCIRLYVLLISHTHFRRNPHFLVSWMSRNSFLEPGAKPEGEVTATGFEPRTTKFLNKHLTIWPSWPNDWAVFWVLISTMHLTVCSCHVTYAFQSESTLFSYPNVKELLAHTSCEIWRWGDCNWSRTKNHLVFKLTLNHLAKLS